MPKTMMVSHSGQLKKSTAPAKNSASRAVKARRAHSTRTPTPIMHAARRREKGAPPRQR